MKIRHTLKLSLLIASASLTLITAAVAADVQYYFAVKGLSLRQTNSGAPIVVTNESPFRFVAEVLASDTNSVTNASVTLPSKILVTLTNVSDDEGVADFALERGFTNKTQLDAAFKAGAYKFIIRALTDGSNSATLTLPKDLYPTAPHIANWADAQEIESKLPFVIRWDAITNIGVNDLVLLNVEETNGNPVLSSPGFFQPGALNGTNLFVEIPLESLDENRVYDAQLLVVKAAVRNTNSVPGATGIGGYFRQTKFPLATLPNPISGGRVQFSSLNYSASESDSAATVTVTRVGDESHAVSVNLTTSNGSAVDGTNYLGVNTTLTFDSDVNSTNILIPLFNDYKFTGNQTVNLALSGLVGDAVFGSRSNSVLTIVDSQKASAGTLQFLSTSMTVTEGTLTVAPTLLRLIGKTGVVTGHFHTEDGSALAGVDYVATNGTITFAAGKTGKFTIPLGILNDSLNKTNKNFFLVLDSTTGGAAIGTNWFVRVNILDNDPGGVINLGSATYATNENNGFFLVSVKRTGTGTLAGNVTVDFATQNGGALAGLDYIATNGTLTFGSNELTKTIAIPVINDNLAEGNEDFFFKLTNVQGGATLGAVTNATLTIKDDESSISISSAVYNVSEAGTNVAITLVRSGPLTSSNSVDFATINGTAVAGSDYTATNGTAVFGANVSSKTIIVPIINDGVIENDESFSFRLSNPQGSALLGTTTNAVVTIANDDFAGTIQFSAATYSGTEGSNAVIKITRTGGLAGGITVQFTSNGGSATPASDYTTQTQVVTFNAGETNKTILIPIILDSLNEATETVNLSLSNVTGGASLGSPSAATLSLLNKPDPNAVPITGPVFMSGTINGTAFSVNPGPTSSSSVTAALFAGGNGMNLVASWAITGTKIVQTHLLTIDPTPFALGTYSLDNNGTHGFMSYTRGDTDISDPFHPIQTGHGYAVADGSASVGSYGTFTYDAIDDANKMISGRFSFHMKEVTDGVVNPGFIDMAGSFRCHYQ